MKRIIEFVTIKQNLPFIVLVDANEIISLEKVSKEDYRLKVKNNEDYMLKGTYRTLSNRWIYALEKKNDLYNDIIMRPSILFFHHRNLIAVDSVYFDQIQLSYFEKCLIEDLENYEKFFN